MGICTKAEERSECLRYGKFIGQSQAMEGVYDYIDRLSPTDETVLVTGESGTGKELVAETLHEQSPRRGKPFIPINCAALPENLFESELFGYKKGAFTGADRNRIGLFQQAEGGTLFLDEIGELPLHLQVKLLRVLQTQEITPLGEARPRRVDTRVVLATNKDLWQGVQAGTIRDDLYYRIAGLIIKMPPLRERKEDIPLLVRHFARKMVRCDPVRFLDKQLQQCICYSWPGNVRELEMKVKQFYVLGERCYVEQKITLATQLSMVESYFIQNALERFQGDYEAAAGFLHINLRTLYRKMRKYDLNAKLTTQG